MKQLQGVESTKDSINKMKVRRPYNISFAFFVELILININFFRFFARSENTTIRRFLSDYAKKKRYIL